MAAEMAHTGLIRELERQGVSRRDFLGFCASMAAVLGLPKTAAATIAAAVESQERPVLVWLEFQDCAGNTESFLRASHPTVADLVLDTISLRLPRDDHGGRRQPGRRRARGHRAQVTRASTSRWSRARFPAGPDSGYCTIGGRSALDIAREVCGSALATIAVGTCAAFGGIPAARRTRRGRSRSPTPYRASRT